MFTVIEIPDQGEIAIPRELLKAFDWPAGTPLTVSTTPMGIFIRPVPTLQQLQGLCQGANTEDYRDRNDRY